MLIELTFKDLSTIKLALMGWSERCRAEAKSMDGLAEQFPDSADQCRKNAAASREFNADAEELLAMLREI